MFHPLRGKYFINAITVPLSANDFAEGKKERKRERGSKVLTEKIIVSVRSRGKLQRDTADVKRCFQKSCLFLLINAFRITFTLAALRLR